MLPTILLIVAVIALVLPVWLLNRANRDRKGRFTRNPWWEWVVLLLGVGIAVMCGFAVAGCDRPAPFAGVPQPSPTLATDPPIQRAQTRSESIAALNVQAKPEANATGQALLTAQGDEIAKLRTDLTDAQTSNALATAGWVKREVEYRAALNAAQDQTKDWKGKHDRVTAQWGYRLQVWVEWAWFWIKCYLAVCAVLFFLRFVPGAVGGFAALAFSVLWVPGWFNAFADNAYFRGWVPWMKKGEK